MTIQNIDGLDASSFYESPNVNSRIFNITPIILGIAMMLLAVIIIYHINEQLKEQRI